MAEPVADKLSSSNNNNNNNKMAVAAMNTDSKACGVPPGADFCSVSEEEAAAEDLVGDGSVNLRGRPVKRSRTGQWKASAFIIGMEFAERIAFYGIASNLVQYLTLVLKQDLAESVKNTNNWIGVTTVVPFIGGFFADAYFGRYFTIAVLSIVYVLGMIFLTLSTTVDPLRPPCIQEKAKTCRSPTSSQVGFFFLSLYLVSIGTGGIKPCLQALGADQFDEDDPKEKKMKSSFFNWWYFALCTGGLFAVTVLVYIQTNVGWDVGFGVPTAAMGMAAVVFFMGTPFYRHKAPGGSPLTRIAQVLVASFHKRHIQVPSDESSLYEIPCDVQTAGRQLHHSKQFKFLDKAANKLRSDMIEGSGEVSVNTWRLCTVTQVEEVKLLIRILPVWLTAFMYGVVFAQSTTLFTKQGAAMNDRFGPSHFSIPPASFQSITAVTVLVTLVAYDLLFVPVARSLTGHARGITLLQRIGVGLFFSILCMVSAALVEERRTSRMSIFWLTPQYVLIGLADVFALVGHQEFFYDQVPDSMRSLGMALYLGAIGVGNFLSSFFILIIQRATNHLGSQRWFGADMNSSHVDRYYWLLAILSTLNFLLFLLVAHLYIYKKPKTALGVNQG